jgi:hypothetical protein
VVAVAVVEVLERLKMRASEVPEEEGEEPQMEQEEEEDHGWMDSFHFPQLLSTSQFRLGVTEMIDSCWNGVSDHRHMRLRMAETAVSTRDLRQAYRYSCCPAAARERCGALLQAFSYVHWHYPPQSRDKNQACQNDTGRAKPPTLPVRDSDARALLSLLVSEPLHARSLLCELELQSLLCGFSKETDAEEHQGLPYAHGRPTVACAALEIDSE